MCYLEAITLHRGENEGGTCFLTCIFSHHKRRRLLFSFFFFFFFFLFFSFAKKSERNTRLQLVKLAVMSGNARKRNFLFCFHFFFLFFFFVFFFCFFFFVCFFCFFSPSNSNSFFFFKIENMRKCIAFLSYF